MNKINVVLVSGLGAVLLCLTGCGRSQESTSTNEPAAALAADNTSAMGCSAEQIEANKRLGTTIRPGVTSEETFGVMHPDYIQHNPIMKRFGEINGVSGREEFKLLVDFSTRSGEPMGPPPPLPGQPKEDPHHLVIADCNHVFVMRKGHAPDPQRPGQFYEVFDFDAWTIKDGKLAEHWDGLRIPQDLPKILKSPVKDLLKESERSADQPSK